MNKNILRSIGFASIATIAIAGCGDSNPDGDGAGGGPSVGGSSAGAGGTGVGGTAGPGAGGTAGPGAGGAAGPGAGGADPGAGGSDPGAGGGDPGAGGGDPGAGGSMGGDGAGGGEDGSGGAGPEVTVQVAQQKQIIRGFGINNNWAPAMSGGTADYLFSLGDNGLGLSILRIGMSSEGEAYNGDDAWADIRAADSRVASVGDVPNVIVMATLWSPPARCKTNESIIDGGHLLESCHDEWSDTIAAFGAKVKAGSGVDLYAMSPQNETDFASCGLQEPCNGNYDTTVMNGAEAAAFQKIVGPKLRAAGVIPMSAEASEWIHVWSNDSGTGSQPSGLDSSDPLDCGFPGTTNCTPGAPFDDGYEYGYALAADPDAWAAFDIMGTHQYDTQVAEAWPDDVPFDKEVWQTEMSGVKWWPEQGTGTGGSLVGSGHIENGVATARWIHSGMVVGDASAWLWWWWKAINDTTDDNEGLVLKDDSLTKRFYTFGNFTRYVRPGYYRVEMTGDVPDKVLLSAYTGPDGTVVVVAINETTAAVDIPITIAGGTTPTEMTPILTSADDNWASQAVVPVTDGIFAAALPAMSVTTFVSQ